MKAFLKIIAIVTLIANQAGAFVPGEEKEITPISAPVDMPKTGFFSAATMNKIMPQNLTQNSDPGQVQKDIINRSVNAIVKSPAISKTGIVQAAEKIETAVNEATEVKMVSEQGVEHKVNVRILPAEAAARVDYTGVATASVTFKPDDVDFTVSEKIAENASLQLKHQTNDHLSSLNIHIEW